MIAAIGLMLLAAIQAQLAHRVCRSGRPLSPIARVQILRLAATAFVFFLFAKAVP